MQWIGKTEAVVDDRRYRLETLALVMQLEAVKLRRAARGVQEYSAGEALAVVQGEIEKRKAKSEHEEGADGRDWGGGGGG